MRPTEADNPVRPMLFFREPAPGEERLYWDDDVRVNHVVQGVDSRLPTAAVTVDSYGLFSPIVPALTYSMMAQRYDPTVRCAIGFAPEPGQPPEVLFHGYTQKRNTSFRSGHSDVGWSDHLHLDSVLVRMAGTADGYVQGRWMLSRETFEAYYGEIHEEDGVIGIDDLPEELWSRSAMLKHVRALNCVFNPDGKPNRHPEPVELTQEEYPHPSVAVHVFTYDGDAEAEYWTIDQALRYLLLFHVPWDLGVEFKVPKLFVNFADPDPLLIRDLHLTEAGQTPPAGQYPQFRLRVTQRCPSLAVEGRDLLAALQLLCRYAGLHFHETHVSVLADYDSFYVQTLLDIWAPLDQDAVVLRAERGWDHHVAGSSPPALRTVPEIVNANQLSQGQIQVDFGSSAADVLLLGDRHHVMVTAELLPLWEKHTRWDGTTGLVASGTATGYREDAFDADDPFHTLEDSAFFERFNPHGNQWGLSEGHRMAGRLWGIDCGGEFSADDYVRTEGPWDDEHSVPFDISSLPVNNTSLPALPGQVVRRRWMEPVTVVDGTGRSRGVVLEMSNDAGDHWYAIEDQFVVLGGTTFLYLKTPDLLQVGQQVFLDHPNPPTANFYDAYLRGTLRLRATFNLDLDERVAASSTGGGRLAPHHVTHGMLRDTDYRLVEADRYVNFFNPLSASPSGGLDDRDAAEALADEIAYDRAAARPRASVVVPWHAIEFPLGVRALGVATRAGVGSPDFSFTDDERPGPHIVGRVFRQTDELSTELLLEDFEMRPHLRPPK